MVCIDVGLSITSVMGSPSVGCGIGVEEGVWVPWMKMIAPRASSADHMGSYMSSPMYPGASEYVSTSRENR